MSLNRGSNIPLKPLGGHAPERLKKSGVVEGVVAKFNKNVVGEVVGVINSRDGLLSECWSGKDIH